MGELGRASHRRMSTRRAGTSAGCDVCAMIRDAARAEIVQGLSCIDWILWLDLDVNRQVSMFSKECSACCVIEARCRSREVSEVAAVRSDV